MIPIDNFIEDAIKKLKKMKPLNCLDIRTYKRDRSVVIEKLEDGYNLYEDGFENAEFNNLSLDELKRLLKIMQKKEFPRSNIVRFYTLKRRDEK
ncbi:hypothetical protein ABFP60_01035 [Clostridioides difficile]